MTAIRFTKGSGPALRGVDKALVIGTRAAFQVGRLPDSLPQDLRALLGDLVSDLKPGLTGASATTLTGTKPRRLIAAVLPEEISRHNSPSRAEAVRRLVKSSGVGGKGKSAVVLLLEDAAHMVPAVNAVGRALPLFSLKRGGIGDGRLNLCAIGPDGAALTITPLAKSVLEDSREAARLVDMPPAELQPETFQEEAWRMLKELKSVRKRSIKGEALLRAKLGGIHGVGRCALAAPRLLIAQYKSKRKGARHVALVGKGVTYDTGGLSIKGRAGMCGMKCDMGGAAAVLGAFLSLVRCGSPHSLSLVICLAENAIGPDAYKPDDVLHMHSGLTVEINNTDAEGRLLLADGVSYAARVLGADTIIDAATLTGAQLVATGKLHAAVISNDEELEQSLISAGRTSGDLTHALPFAPEFYKAEFKSQVADMRNSVADRANAQASCAAEFIHWHIEDTDVRWAHVDLAGPAFRGDRGTGFGVALLTETVRSL